MNKKTWVPKVDDWVVITKSSINWTSTMDKYIGKVVQIIECNDNDAIRFKNDEGYTWRYSQGHFKKTLSDEYKYIEPEDPNDPDITWLEVIEDLHSKTFTGCTNIPKNLKVGSITWVYKPKMINDFYVYLIEDNRYSANIPSKYFKIINLPKDDFILPKKWYVKVTKENEEILKKWVGNSYNLWNDKLAVSYAKCWHNEYNLKGLDIIKISFENFQKYVLKIPILHAIEDILELSDSHLGEFVSFTYQGTKYDKALFIYDTNENRYYLLNNVRSNYDGHNDKSRYKYSLVYDNLTILNRYVTNIKLLKSIPLILPNYNIKSNAEEDLHIPEVKEIPIKIDYSVSVKLVDIKLPDFSIKPEKVELIKVEPYKLNI